MPIWTTTNTVSQGTCTCVRVCVLCTVCVYTYTNTHILIYTGMYTRIASSVSGNYIPPLKWVFITPLRKQHVQISLAEACVGQIFFKLIFKLSDLPTLFQ